jgi:hypothetical protein
MTNQIDSRIAELEALAREEGLDLPYSPNVIIALEDRGSIVDLVTGQVYSAVTVTPTRHTQALNHLLNR